MKLDDLRGMTADQLKESKAPYAAAAQDLRDKLREQEAIIYAHNIAHACLTWGAWIGDKVQVNGKVAGKTNPVGYLRGFENPEFSGGGWPIVYLILANGKESDNPTRIWSSQTLTKI